MTEAEAKALQERVTANRDFKAFEAAMKAGIPVPLPDIPMVGAKANLTPRDRGMNKTETKFSHRLEALKRAGAIVDWRFEALKFRLADMTTYTPDFLVIGIDGSIALIDTKAYWKKAGKVGITEDANVKIKVVAEQYPWFTFQTTWEHDGGWHHKTY